MRIHNFSIVLTSVHIYTYPLDSPTVVEEAVVEIESGRHPVIDLLLIEGEQYVANSTSLNVRVCICTLQSAISDRKCPD